MQQQQQQLRQASINQSPPSLPGMDTSSTKSSKSTGSSTRRPAFPNCVPTKQNKSEGGEYKGKEGMVGEEAPAGKQARERAHVSGTSVWTRKKQRHRRVSVDEREGEGRKANASRSNQYHFPDERVHTKVHMPLTQRRPISIVRGTAINQTLILIPSRSFKISRS